MGESVGKSRVLGVRKRIFIPDLYQKRCGFGAVTWREKQRETSYKSNVYVMYIEMQKRKRRKNNEI